MKTEGREKITTKGEKEIDRDKESKSQQNSPAEAEEGQVKAQQSGHHVPDKGTGLAGVEVDPKPHGHHQGEQLTRHKVNLHKKRETHGSSDIKNKISHARVYECI